MKILALFFAMICFFACSADDSSSVTSMPEEKSSSSIMVQKNSSSSFLSIASNERYQTAKVVDMNLFELESFETFFDLDSLKESSVTLNQYATQFEIEDLSFDPHIVSRYVLSFIGNKVNPVIYQLSKVPVALDVPDSLLGYFSPTAHKLLNENSKGDCAYRVLILQESSVPSAAVVNKVSVDTISVVFIDRKKDEEEACRYQNNIDYVAYILKQCGDEIIFPENRWIVKQYSRESAAWTCENDGDLVFPLEVLNRN